MPQRTKYKVAYQDEVHRKKWGVFESEPSGIGGSAYVIIKGFSSKSKAVNYARNKAKEAPRPSKLIVEKMNGRISEESNYKPKEGEYYR